MARKQRSMTARAEVEPPEAKPGHRRSAVEAVAMIGWIILTAVYHSAHELDFLRSKTWPLLFGALVLCLLAAFRFGRTGEKPPTSGIEGWLLLWSVVLVGSSLLAPHPNVAAWAVATTLAPIIACYCTLEIRRQKNEHHLVMLLSVPSVLTSAVAILQSLGISPLEALSASVREVNLEGLSESYAAFSTLGHKNLMASFALMGGMLAIGNLLGASHGWSRIWALIAATVNVGAIVISHSRTSQGTALVLVLGIAWLAAAPKLEPYLSRISRLSLLAVGILVAIVGSAVLLGSEKLREVLSISDPWNAFNHRGAHWLVAIEMVKHHPFFGVGPGHFGQAYTDHLLIVLSTVADPFRGGTLANQAHCDPLQIAAETGLVGFLSYGALCMGMGIGFFRSRPHVGIGIRSPRLGPLFAVLAYFLVGLLDFPAASPPHTLVLWTCVGLLLRPAERTPTVLVKVNHVGQVWLGGWASSVRKAILVGALILAGAMTLEVWQARSADRMTALGRRIYHQGDMHEARKLLEQAVYLDPTIAQAWFWLARLEHRESRLEQAASYLERSRSLWPFHPVDLALGYVNYDRKHWAEAKQALNRYLKVRPMAPPRDYGLLLMVMKQGGETPSEHTTTMAKPAKRLEQARLIESEGKLGEAFSWYLSLETDAGFLAAARTALRMGKLEQARAVVDRITSPMGRELAAALLKQAGVH